MYVISYIVLYLCEYEKIISRRICLPDEYSFSSLSQKFFFRRGNCYFNKTIQCFKKPSLSLFTESLRGKSGKRNTEKKGSLHCETRQKSSNSFKETCKEDQHSIEYSFGQHYRYFSQNKVKGWRKRSCRKKLNPNTILIGWHLRDLLMSINFLSLTISQDKLQNLRNQMIFQYQNKNNYDYANSSYICPSFI